MKYSDHVYIDKGGMKTMFTARESLEYKNIVEILRPERATLMCVVNYFHDYILYPSWRVYRIKYLDRTMMLRYVIT